MESQPDKPVARAFASVIRNPFVIALTLLVSVAEAYNGVFLPAIVNTEQARIKIQEAENAATLLKAQADEARAKACEQMFKTYADPMSTRQPDVLKPCFELASNKGKSRVAPLPAENSSASTTNDEMPKPNTGDPKLDEMLTHLFGDLSKPVGTPQQ